MVKSGEVVWLSKVRRSDPLADGVDRYVGLERMDLGD
jgi:type I restriction enzyme S subunit